MIQLCTKHNKKLMGANIDIGLHLFNVYRYAHKLKSLVKNESLNTNKMVKDFIEKCVHNNRERI